MTSVRRAATLLLLGCGVVWGQTTLPVTNPTALPAVNSTAGSVAGDKAKGEETRPVEGGVPTHRAVVVYTGGRLEVTADNSSLNQILHEIGRQVGMTITGGVQDDRVFGHYGPATPTEVLDDLLDGTGVNMLVRESAADTPKELVLSRREGGPTPPNSKASREDDDEPVTAIGPPSQQPQQNMNGDAPAQLQVGGSLNPGPGNAAVGPAPDASGSPGPGAPGGGVRNPASPNGVQTPQQIYQQLQQLQQAQPKQ